MFGSDGPVSASTYNILCRSISATPFSLSVRPPTFRGEGEGGGGGWQSSSRKGGNGKVTATDRCSRLSNIYVVLPSIHSLMINCCEPKAERRKETEKLKTFSRAKQCTCIFSFLKSKKYAKK